MLRTPIPLDESPLCLFCAKEPTGYLGSAPPLFDEWCGDCEVKISCETYLDRVMARARWLSERGWIEGGGSPKFMDRLRVGLRVVFGLAVAYEKQPLKRERQSIFAGLVNEWRFRRQARQSVKSIRRRRAAGTLGQTPS